MKKILLSILSLTLVYSVAFNAYAYVEQQNDLTLTRQLLKDKTIKTPFSQLGATSTLTLRGNGSSVGVNFGIRNDQIISQASVTFSYVYSPSFLERLSHIKVYLNEEVIGVLPMTNDNAGNKVNYSLPIDPQLITDYNQLSLQMIGHYQDNQCEDPQHSSIWADISAKSEFIFKVESLPISNNLAIFPKPFFDEHSSKQVIIPYVFANAPSHPQIEAAAILSSWFGAKAEWRGINFPVLINQRPSQHAIVFATNENRPEFLKQYPLVDEPTIAMISLPIERPENLPLEEDYPTHNPYIKLLLVLAKDDEGLKLATQALVLGKATLAGKQATIKSVDLGLPRKAYDAPNWVRLDRPTKLGELVNSLTELQVTGHSPKDIRLNIRIPADLFTWRSSGIPVDLRYRYTPLVTEDESRLNVNINQQFVEAFNLQSSGKGGKKQRVRVPLLDEGLFGVGNEFFIPAFKLGSHNQLSFSFSFAYETQGLCQSNVTDNVQAAIDADSTIDFTGFPHYAALPNLGFFANSGYPFSVHADMADTTIIVSDQASLYETETILNVLGYIGISTGYPATRLTIASPNQVSKQQDKNLIIVGNKAHQTLVKEWQLDLPLHISDLGMQQSAPAKSVNLINDWLGLDTQPDPTKTSEVFIKSKGILGALIGFESPLSSGKSVVSLVGASDQDLSSITQALNNSAKVSQMHGSVVLIRPHSIESLLVGDTYTVGNLPWYIEVWYFLSKHPVILAIFSMFSIILISFLLWRALGFVMKQRIKGDDE